MHWYPIDVSSYPFGETQVNPPTPDLLYKTKYRLSYQINLLVPNPVQKNIYLVKKNLTKNDSLHIFWDSLVGIEDLKHEN